MKKYVCLGFMLAVAALAGCSMAPKYIRPEASVPAALPTGEAYSKAPASGETLPAWRDFFPDENLKKLIDTALTNNLDLRLAALNVEVARGTYGVQRASLLPALGATGTAVNTRVPGDLSDDGRTRYVEENSVNFGISSWEIDFFGRIASLKNQALESYLATEEARRSVRIALIAGVARGYLTLAADTEALGIARATLMAQEETYRMMQAQENIGVITALEVNQARTQVENARASVALYVRQVAMDKNALVLLLGAPLGEDLLPKDLKSILLPKEMFPGMKSEILLVRPDILGAEHRLKGANANIGAARAAFFPRIALTSLVGTGSDALSDLFAPGTGTWNFTPVATLPIFDPRLFPALRVSKADREIAQVNYQKTIQTAFQEVSDALAMSGTIGEQYSAQQALCEASSNVFALTSSRYAAGVSSYLEVLIAQRSLFAAEQVRVVVGLANAASRINLYAVLGGGAS